MLKRALVIFILIVVTVAATLPYGESLASYGRRAVAGRSNKQRAKRRSRAWWRRRRAYLRRQRAAALARRRGRRAWALRRRHKAAARARQAARAGAPKPTTLPAGTANLRALLSPARLPTVSPSAVESIPAIAVRVNTAPDLAPALAHAATPPRPAAVPAATPSPLLAPAPRVTPSLLLSSSPLLASSPLLGSTPLVVVSTLADPSPITAAPRASGVAPRVAGAAPAAHAAPAARRFAALPAPRTWQNVSSTLAGEFKFSLRGTDGRAVGTAVWSRLAPAPAADSPSDRRTKKLGGVTLAALRRTVIDRMIAEGGWVVNDFEREIAGGRVFVVVAQSEGEGGTRRNWTYYFTEADGQLYSLSTTAPTQFAEAVAADAEGVVSSVLSRARAAAAPAKN